ncbi:MAG TPA: galactose mutarotase [Polyangiaceae bacterium]|jgi:galactose mutarotase-like enzyme|nr:galactose mutarotase [Polyangiaceae bacterium]
MPGVTSRDSGNSTVGEVFVLEDETARSRVELAPKRGALVTAMRVGDRDVLYLDEATLKDPSKSVRGGIPVLFPSPGKLVDDEWRDGDRAFTMKQHGFARTMPWSVLGWSSEGAASVTLGLASNGVTLAEYPWAFHTSLTFTLSGPKLRITSKVWNDSGSEMRFGIGYHPYFKVDDKAHARVDTRATQAFDNVKKQNVPFAGFDFTAKEVDMHLLDHGSTATTLHLGDGGHIDVRGSAEFTRWVVWTLEGKPFVCVEPWSAPGNALNTGEHLLRLPPGGALETFIEIAAG